MKRLALLAGMFACGGSSARTGQPPVPVDGAGVDSPSADAAVIDGPIDGPIDGAIADAVVPHDGPPLICPTLGPYCDGTYLYDCVTIGHVPTITECSAGCLTTPQPHCGVIIPTGVVTTADLAPDSRLLAVTLATPTTVNTDTGEIVGVRAAGTGVVSGVDFSVRNGVGVFRFANLSVMGALTFVGRNAVAFVSLDAIHATAVLDLTGTCAGTNAGPGGTPGATAGSGAGGAGIAASGGFPGGGGGAFGAAGGVGGPSVVPGGAAGAAFDDPAITLLRGGGGGGTGAGASGGVGGGGGGAIQLVAYNLIQFTGSSTSFAGVFAGGCGGKHGLAGVAGGGGGGAGGAILMEAPYIESNFTYSAFIAAGGGGGADDYLGTTDADGQAGGRGSRGGIPGGGDGGTREYNNRTIAGGDGGGNGTAGGGGGGGAGRIRFNYVTYLLNGGDTIPSTADTITTATLGSAAVE